MFLPDKHRVFILSFSKEDMKFDENLSSIHAYLCADGYVIKNPNSQRHKYYRIGLRNNNSVLLKDFQNKFFMVFGVVPRLILGERCEIGSKEIYERLSKTFGSFYSWEWKMPKLNKKLTKIWLRSYFDCEGWVFCKSHKNRHVGADCVNEKGLDQIIDEMNKIGIRTIKKYNKKRNIYRILIYGKDNLNKFFKLIGFLHPDKLKKLKEILEDFIVYEWSFPQEEEKCKKFIKELLNEKIRIKKPYYARIISKEENNLKKLNKWLKYFYNIEGRINKGVNGRGTIYFELNINKKKDIENLINNKIINNILINK